MSSYRPRRGRGNFSRPRQNYPRNNYHAYNQHQNSSPQLQNNSDNTQLWMGDLDPRWDENAVVQIWSSCDLPPANVRIIKDKTGTNKPSYGFVTFATPAAAAAAIQRNHTPVPGSQRTFRLNWASGGGGGPSASTGPRASGPTGTAGSSGNGPAPRDDPSVFVGDLAPEVTEQMLYEVFNAKYTHQIKQVKVVAGTNGQLKGFGFVRFLSPAVQQAALAEMSGVLVGSRRIRVGLPASHGQSADLAPLPSPGAGPSNAQSTAALTAALAATVHVPQAQPALRAYTDPYNTTVAVKGLSSDVDEAEVVQHFASFGPLVFCNLVSSENSAYIRFYTREDAETAMVFLTGTTLRGCRVVLSWASCDVSGQPLSKGDHVAQKKPPKLYGYVPAELNFEHATKEELEQISNELSEPLTVPKINSMYLESRQRAEEVLRAAY